MNNFNPEHCIVTSINKSTKTYSEYSHDHIRHDNNRYFGSTTTENITTYNFKTASPKTMIDIRDEETVTKSIDIWNPILFDKRQVKTINPELSKINICGKKHLNRLHSCSSSNACYTEKPVTGKIPSAYGFWLLR